MLKNHIHLSIDYGYKVALAHWSRMSCVHGSLTSKYNASATKLTEAMNDEENRQNQVLSKNEIVYFCNWVSFLIFSWHRSIFNSIFCFNTWCFMCTVPKNILLAISLVNMHYTCTRNVCGCVVNVVMMMIRVHKTIQ